MSARSLWVSIDGAEGSGKTTLSNFLHDRLSPEAVVVPEFSSSPVGLYLGEAVVRSPHYLNHSLLGQSLYFLGDYADLAEDASRMRGSRPEYILQDRGYLSKLVYQVLVLRGSLGRKRATQLVLGVLECAPRPDVVVLLDAGIGTLHDRLRVARNRELTPNELTFIAESLTMFRDEFHALAAAGFETLLVYQNPSEDVSTVGERLRSDLARFRSSRNDT